MSKRHVEALHDLSREEFAELAEIQYKLSQVMRQMVGVQKEYMSCYAEGMHFNHIHIHFVAKPETLPTELKGPRSFALLAVDEQQAVSPAEIIAFSEDCKEKFLAVD